MKRAGFYFLIAMGCAVGITFLLASYLVLQIPSEKHIRGCQTTTMFSVKLCPGSDSYEPLKQISPFLKKAVVLTEDSAFYQHNGFDWEELKKSFITNLEKGKFARGGSTISQQLAKNMYLNQEKSLLRKLKEAVITMQIEKSLKKDEILERYLNVVQFGPKIFGVKQGAQFYFHKSPANLELVECAFLAFLLPNPEKYSISYFRKELTGFARKRMRQIIQNMYQYQRITNDEYQYAIGKLAGFPGSVLSPEPADFGPAPTLQELEAEDALNGFSEPAAPPDAPKEPQKLETPEQQTDREFTEEIQSTPEAQEPEPQNENQ